MAIIVDKLNVAYFPAPKVACTSLKYMFYYIENNKEYIPTIRNSIKVHVHGYYPTSPFSRAPMKRIENYYKFCVVRDPIKRLISCYANRVLFHKELSENRLSVDAIKAGARPNPSIEYFIENLELYREHSPSITHHTDLQCKFIGNDPKFYSRIYKMNELEILKDDISEIYGEKLNLPHSQTGGPKLGIEEISERSKSKLIRFYEKDYNTYEF